MTDKKQSEDWIDGLSDTWSEAMRAWEQLAKGAIDFDPFAGRMATAAQAFASLLGGFGKDGADTWSAAEIARRWRELVAGGTITDPLAGVPGPGAGGGERWFASLQQRFGRELRAGLDLPAFGPAREQQEHWQALLKAQLDAQEAQAAYQRLLAQALERAFVLFENKLAEHEAPGRQLTSVRAVYDLWIDAAEEAYAEVALREDFAKVYGNMVNSQSRLRIASAVEVEAWCKAMGLPTRSEVTASHRKVHALEREVRALKAQLAASSQPSVSAPQRVSAAAKKSAHSPAPQKTARRKATSKTSAPRRASATQVKPAVRRGTRV